MSSFGRKKTAAIKNEACNHMFETIVLVLSTNIVQIDN